MRNFNLNSKKIFQYQKGSQNRRAILISSIWSLLLFAPANAEQADAVRPITDLRVIVDISGSMKKTDPKNLRRPAVRLLAGLIPEGSRSGIWNFGQQVNMSVKIGSVDEAWRKLAREESKKINSVGLYTNIESAMRKASFDWNKPDPRYKRNLILLTDGHVDISGNDQEDQASRNRIIKEVLPALEKAKVRIHTIALSDDVDESLLSTLSAYTDGLYKKVNSADELQKLFLQMLEQSVALNTLPIKDNFFSVDSSVNDMTLLVFNQDKTKPTQLVTPDNKLWAEKTSPETVSWYRDEGFDLVTIKKPKQGQWKILAPVDQNNRVVVATNLKLKVNKLPGHLMYGDSLEVSAQLTEDDKALADSRLLSKFNFSIKQTINNHDERLYEMSRPEDANNTSYYKMPPVTKEGLSELVIRAVSPTVEREIRHQFKIYETPAEIQINEKEGKFEIKITPYSNLLRPESVKINAVLEDKSSHEFRANENKWTQEFENKYHNTPVTINIKATRADGKDISMSFTRILKTNKDSYGLKLAEDKNFAAAHLTSAKQESDKNKSDKKIFEGKDEQKISEPDSKETEKQLPKRTETREKEHEMSTAFIIGAVVIGNIILVLLLGGAYYFIKKRKDRESKDFAEQMDDLDTAMNDK